MLIVVTVFPSLIVCAMYVTSDYAMDILWKYDKKNFNLVFLSCNYHRLGC